MKIGNSVRERATGVLRLWSILRVVWLVGGFVGCLIVDACHSAAATEVGDPRACQQTSEFANSGCFAIEGQIVGFRGQPLPRISVVGRSPLTKDAFALSVASTDEAGRFRLRGARMGDVPPTGLAPDTVSLYVVAADPASAGINIPAKYRDSVLARATIAPVGEIPQPTEIQITLAVP